MKLSKRSQKTIDKLALLLEEEHIDGCGQETCSINKAYEHGFVLHAIYNFSHTGAASIEFDELCKTLPKSFRQAEKKDCQQFIKTVSHAECPHCNAVTWDANDHGDTINCDNCANDFDRETGLDIDEGL